MDTTVGGHDTTRRHSEILFDARLRARARTRTRAVGGFWRRFFGSFEDEDEGEDEDEDEDEDRFGMGELR
jgi:hypothetical protein